MRVTALDATIALYENPVLVDIQPKGWLSALYELREQFNRFNKPSELGNNIHEVHIEVNGTFGSFAIHFQMTRDSANKWQYELSDLLSDLLGVTFERAGSYRIANWRDNIEICAN
ncbi:MAG: hypothetical protein AAB669_03440 [Patescibacteria group bacterium]